MRFLRRQLRKIISFFVLGVCCTLAVSWILAATIDVQKGRQSSADYYGGDGHWTLSKWERGGATLLHSIRQRGMNWSPEQATGQPNTFSVGDMVTAWASQSPDSGPEWLVLDYANAVIAREVHVYESYSPGALVKVTVFDASGTEVTAWTGTDPSLPSGTLPTTAPGAPAMKQLALPEDEGLAPSTAPPNTNGPTAISITTPGSPALPPSSSVPVSKIPISLNIKTNRIKLYLASDKVPGWNEIDAVGLIDDRGQTQWARRCTASSTYASNSGSPAGGTSPLLLLPAWSDLDRATPSYASSESSTEERLIDARGWPMLAMASERHCAPAASSAASPINLTSSSTLTYLGGLPPPGTSAYSAIPYSPAASAYDRPPIPLRPIWTGLITNSIFYGTLLAACWYLATFPRRFFREVARFRHGCCIDCGYDLGYDFIRGCPECGWRRERVEELGLTRPVKSGEAAKNNGH